MFDLSSRAPAVRRTGFILLLLFCGSIFISKAAVNMTVVLLLPVSLVYFFRCGRRDVLHNRCFPVLLLPLLLGLVAAPFSDLGVMGIFAFLKEYRFFLLIIPVAAFVSRNKDIEALVVVLNVSALVSIIYGMARQWPEIQPDLLFTSFHTIGRNSDLLFSLVLVNIVAIIKYRFASKNRLIKSLLGLNTLFLLYGLLAMKIAGAWLGLLVGVFILLFLCNKKALILLCMVCVCSSFYLPDFVKTEMTITADYKSSYSSKVRIQLNKTGFDYLVDQARFITGTGTDNAKKVYIRFMERKPQSYREKYAFAYHDLPGNFHNSFLQMAVEGGIFFMLAYLAGILYLIIQMFRTKKRMEHNDQTIILATVSLTPGFFVSQLFHGGLFGYAGLVFTVMFYSGCVVMTRYSQSFVLDRLPCDLRL